MKFQVLGQSTPGQIKAMTLCSLKKDKTVLASRDGMKRLPGTVGVVLPRVYSDHSPLLINLGRGDQETYKYVNIFRYEAAWDLRKDCAKVIQDCWPQHISSINGKLASCKQALTRWRKSI